MKKLKKYYVLQQLAPSGRYWTELERFESLEALTPELKQACKDNPGEMFSHQVIYIYE